MIEQNDPQIRKPNVSRANKGQAIRDLNKGRICSSCGLYKERECFSEHPTGFNGLMSRCKECNSKASSTPAARELKKESYNQRKENGECVKCGSIDLVNNVFCEKCWFADIASKRAGGVKFTQDIMRLWETQRGLCFYTNQKLIPGKNASIDHQMPRSRGGTDKITNLRWVSDLINRMKSDMTHEEFVSLCRKISLDFEDKK